MKHIGYVHVLYIIGAMYVACGKISQINDILNLT